MENLEYCKGLRIYGIYQFKDYPEWDILCTDIEEQYMNGLAFTKNGKFDTGVTLATPMMGKEVGYIYNPNKGFNLILNTK